MLPESPDRDKSPRRVSNDVEGNFIPPKEGLLILGLQLLLLLFRLGTVPLLGPDEPRYARVAVEMARSNEFVTPTLAGEPWLEKPPLYYWLAGFGYRLVGENEWAARWPAVLAALLMTGFTGLAGARLFGHSVGRLAMLVMATAPILFAYGRAASMDMLVAAFMTGASVLFILSILGIAGPSARTAAWAMMALAVLAKGPVGLVLPIATALLTAALLRRFDLSRLISVGGIVLCVLIAAPWFGAIYLAQGFHFVEVFLLNHNLQRFTSTIHNHPGPFYYYLPVLFLGVFPWSGLFAMAPAGLRSAPAASRTALLAWLATPLVFFSLAGSKLPGYILPCLPPLAIVLALAGKQLRSDANRVGVRVAGLLGLLLSASILAMCVRAIREGEPWGRIALMPAVWLLAMTFIASRALDSRHRDTLRVLYVGAAGFLLLLTLVSPPLLEAMESGRRLFLPAQGREVLAVGAWRTAWMSGYFYNDGKVAESSMADLPTLVATQPRLVIFGPAEWRAIQKVPGLGTLKLAEGPRGNVMAKVSTRSPD